MASGLLRPKRYRDQTERTSRSKWAVTFDEQSNPLIECSFTISDAVSNKRSQECWNVMRRAGIISIHDQLAAPVFVHRSSSYNVPRKMFLVHLTDKTYLKISDVLLVALPFFSFLIFRASDWGFWQRILKHKNSENAFYNIWIYSINFLPRFYFSNLIYNETRSHGALSFDRSIASCIRSGDCSPFYLIPWNFTKIAVLRRRLYTTSNTIIWNFEKKAEREREKRRAIQARGKSLIHTWMHTYTQTFIPISFSGVLLSLSLSSFFTIISSLCITSLFSSYHRLLLPPFLRFPSAPSRMKSASSLSSMYRVSLSSTCISPFSPSFVSSSLALR